MHLGSNSRWSFSNYQVLRYGEQRSAAAWVFWCSEAQVLCQKHRHDLGQVHHGGAVHVLLCVVQRVPELWEGSGDDVKHRDPCMSVRGRERKIMMKTDGMCYTTYGITL